ncbi:MAG: LysR family substrate-binding domain-containing protein [Shinella sp.]|nr:LysR family substrate-binding domain-containing protein [Shinella sp.]
MANNPDEAILRIAVSFGALNQIVATLLSAHRQEEPRTAIKLVEARLSEQMNGLRKGSYNLGLSLAEANARAISSLPLHQDEMAIALPVRSPLLTYERIPLCELANYPLIMWSEEACAPMSAQIKAMMESEGVSITASAEARTLAIMVSLVAAGYGIAIVARSKIEAARDQGIVMRPIAGVPRYFTTYLHYQEKTSGPAVQRFIKRASRVAGTLAVAD